MSNSIPTLLILILFCSNLGAQNPLFAQADDEEQKSKKPSQSIKGLEFKGLTRKAQGRARSGSMLVLLAHVKNHSNEPAEGELVGKVTGFPGDEFRTKVKLQGKEERHFDLSIRVPPKVPGNMIEISATINVMENGREIVLLGHEEESAFHTLDLMVVDRKSMYASMLDPAPPYQLDWRWPPTLPHFNYNFAMTSGVEAGISRASAMVDTGLFPINMADWDSLDSLVVSNDQVFADAASVQAMQQFMLRGGRIWFMVDSMSTDNLREFLQPGQECETVGQVDLFRFVVDVHSQNELTLEDRTEERDHPIRLKRLLQRGGRVSHSIDGWPIAIWMPVGQGEMVITALGNDGWIVPNSVHRNPDPEFQSNFRFTKWGTNFANQVHERKPTMALTSQSLSYPLEHIGNPVVSFAMVGTVLFTFCSLLLIFGLWRYYVGNLSWIGAVAPLAAIISCLPLFFVALKVRHEIPPLVTKLQFIHIGEQGGILLENAAVYNTESQSMKLSFDSDGLARPSKGIENGVRVTTHEDIHEWSLSNDNWPAGTFRYQSEVALNQPTFVARAELTAAGLSVELPAGLPSPMEDVVVSFIPGSVSLGKTNERSHRILFDGQFEAAGDRWTTDTFVTDEQIRRASVYRDLFFATSNPPRLPTRTLYGWTGLWKEGPKWDSGFETRGAALVSMPIDLVVPEIGREVLIPHSLVTIERPRQSNGVTLIYNFASGRWADESTLDANGELGFSLPQEALPIEASSVNIQWDIRAPKRKARLVHNFKGKKKEIVSLNEPSIPWNGTLKDAELLEDFRDGYAEFQVEVTSLNDDSESDVKSFVSWKIKHLRISVAGKTLPQDSFVTRP